MKRQILLVIVVLALAGLTGLQDLGLRPVSAQFGGGYDLTWNTIDGGGSASIGSNYTLAGTIGQPDAGVAMMGGGFTLAGGFWGSGTSQYQVYLPVVIK